MTVKLLRKFNTLTPPRLDYSVDDDPLWLVFFLFIAIRVRVRDLHVGSSLRELISRVALALGKDHAANCDPSRRLRTFSRAFLMRYEARPKPRMCEN